MEDGIVETLDFEKLDLDGIDLEPGNIELNRVPSSMIYHVLVPNGLSPRETQALGSRLKKILPPSSKFFITTKEFNLHALSRNEIFQFKVNIDKLVSEILAQEKNTFNGKR
jgi:uncharacterized membrane protein YbjE (DUF340 family)